MTKVSTIDFFAYQWTTEEEQDGTLIRIYGTTRDNKNVYVRVDNFTPYCYVELPTHLEWTEARIQMVANKLSVLNRSIYQPIKKDFVMRRKLYYSWKEKRKQKDDAKLKYKDKLFPFLFFAFRSTTALRNFGYAMKKEIEINGLGKFKFILHEHEAGISPVIKLLALKKLPAAGWIKVRGITIPDSDKESTFDMEISCSYENLSPIDDPTIIHPRVLSFDIEANSTITSAMPDASRPNDKVFQIGCVDSVCGIKKKYLFSLGNPDQKLVGMDVELKTYKTEADLLVSFRDFIREKEYNVIIGYNILGWDFMYMISRAKYTKCLSEFDTIGCLQGVHDKEVAPNFESKAYSAQKLVYLDSEGRLYLDLLPIIKRDYKILNYRLKTVTTHFGLPTKDPLTAQDIFKCYRDFTPKSLGDVGKYCVQDAYITLLLYEKLQLWYGLCEMAKTAHVPIFWLFTKGTQIQMFSQVMEHCMYNNYVVISNGYTPKEGDEYLGAIVLTPIPGKYKKVVSFDFASLYPSIMMAYNIDYSTFIPEPEQMLVDEFDEVNYKINWRTFPCVIKISIPEEKLEKYEDIENRIELKERMLYLRKKYPHRILAIQAERSDISDDDCHCFVWSDHSNCLHDEGRKRKKNGDFSTAKKKVICGQRYYRFIKADVGGKGVIPTLLESLISRRKLTRGEIATNEKEIKQLLISLLKNCSEKKECINFIEIFKSQQKKFFENIESDIEKCDSKSIDSRELNEMISRINFLDTSNQILDKRQASYKICANSMYGAMGVKKGYLPLMPGASTVTYRGRTAIEFISTYIPEKYNGVTVYGDTDSSHIYFPYIDNNKDAVDLAEKITSEMEQFFPKPMKLEFEKIYEKYIILTKKRYMAMVANKKGEIIDFTKKGVCLSRRDNCLFLRDIYLKITEALLEDVNCDNILGMVVEGINSLFQRTYKFKDFVITKNIGRAGYDGNRKLPAHVEVSERMKSRGIQVAAGSRIEYIFTTRYQGEKNFNQGEKAEDLDYFTRWRKYLRVDYLYYMEKQIIKPLDELLKVGLGVEDFVKHQFELRTAKWRVNERIQELFLQNITIDGEQEIETSKVKTKPIKKEIKKERKIVNEDETNEDVPKIVEEINEKEMWANYNEISNQPKKKNNTDYYTQM